jgi:hypothetical protein
VTVAAGRFSALAAFPPEISVSVCTTGTSTLASLYTDHTNGTAAPNPVTTDEDGNLQFFAMAGDVDLKYPVGSATRKITVTVRPDPRDAWPG